MDRPAVALRFDAGPDVEITPAHITNADDYYIPDPRGTGWIKSSPLKHNEYVNETRRQVPEAKNFIRLIEEWKYKRDVPISSLYLEMRAAQHVRGNPPFVMIMDLAWYLRDLDSHQLADMNDPSNFDGRRIVACKPSQSASARAAVKAAAEAAEEASTSYRNGNESRAVAALEGIFQ